MPNKGNNNRKIELIIFLIIVALVVGGNFFYSGVKNKELKANNIDKQLKEIENSKLSSDEKKMASFQILWEHEALMPLRDSAIFLGINLQCTSQAYQTKIKQLLQQKTLIKKNGEIVYYFQFQSGAGAYGKLIPHFIDDRLYCLEIETRFDEKSYMLPDIRLFSLLSNLLEIRYKNYRNIMLVISDAYLYERNWYGDGKNISLNTGRIKYIYVAEAEKVRKDEEIKYKSISNDL